MNSLDSSIIVLCTNVDVRVLEHITAKGPQIWIKDVNDAVMP